MKIIICDDQISDIQELKKLCERYLRENDIEAELETTTHPQDVLAEPLDADILILDIEMGAINGIDIKNQLARRGAGPLIIFATSHMYNVLRAFNVNVIGFVSKPPQYDDLAGFLDTGVNLIFANKSFTYPDGSSGCLDEIVWIEADTGYADAHLRDGRVKNIGKQKVGALAAKLEPLCFNINRRGHIVNCKHISSFYDDRILLKNVPEKSGGKPSDKVLLISRRRRKECLEKYTAYCMRTQKYI